MWIKAPEEEQQKYKDKAEKLWKEWKDEMIKWVKTRSIAERAELMAKHGLLNEGPNKRKRDRKKLNETSLEKSCAIGDLRNGEQSPSKKKKQNSITEITNDDFLAKNKEKMTLVSETSKDDIISHGEQQSSSKKKKGDFIAASKQDDSKSDSPKKKKDIIDRLGPYPSLTTAHYFMTSKCAGMKTKKVAKAYKKLSKLEKKKLFLEMCSLREAYLKNLKKNAIDKDENSKIIEFHKKNRDAQSNEISWHIGSGTDMANSSSSSSDDSDDS